MLTACICVAAIVWQSSYGDAAIIATWAPQRVVTSSPALDPRATRAAEPTCRSGGRGEDITSATSTSGSNRTGRRRADRRGHRRVARVDAVAPVDGARSRNRGARNRAAQPKNKWPALLPRLPSRTFGPRYQRFRHGRLHVPTHKPVPTLPSPQAAARPQAEEPQLSSARRQPMPVR